MLKLIFVCDRPHTCCHHLECHVSGVGGGQVNTQRAESKGAMTVAENLPEVADGCCVREQQHSWYEQ